jgi:hypothetical protein
MVRVGSTTPRGARGGAIVGRAAPAIKPGVTSSTITTVLSDTRQIIAALREVGWTEPKAA